MEEKKGGLSHLFSWAAAGAHECSPNVLKKTELPALAATAFHADLAIEMVVWAGWLPHRAVHAAAIKPQAVGVGTPMGSFLEEVRTIRRFTAELAEPDIFPKHQASAGTIAVAVPSSGLAV